MKSNYIAKILNPHTMDERSIKFYSDSLRSAKMRADNFFKLSAPKDFQPIQILLGINDNFYTMKINGRWIS